MTDTADNALFSMRRGPLGQHVTVRKKHAPKGACEICWDLAFAKTKEDTSKSQSEHYELIALHHDKKEKP
jgi:hypothetical protein